MACNARTSTTAAVRFVQLRTLPLQGALLAAGLRVKQRTDTAKQVMREMIARQPDDSSYEEILRELAFLRVVENGLADSDAGRCVSNEDNKGKLDSWQK